MTEALGARGVRLKFLADVDAVERERLLTGIERLRIAPGQEVFCPPGAENAARIRSDATRDAFAVMIGDTVVGVGVLHPDAADAVDWPEQTPHVLLRSFHIDVERQGQGIGTEATRLAVEAARTRHPRARDVVLLVNVDNEPGQRAYSRAGFRDLERVVPARAGLNRAMALSLS